MVAHCQSALPSTADLPDDEPIGHGGPRFRGSIGLSGRRGALAIRRTTIRAPGDPVEGDPLAFGGLNTWITSVPPRSEPFAFFPYGDTLVDRGVALEVEPTQKEGGTVGGTTRCCGGNAVALRQSNICDGLSPGACAVVRRCAERHEKYHVDHHNELLGKAGRAGTAIQQERKRMRSVPRRGQVPFDCILQRQHYV